MPFDPTVTELAKAGDLLSDLIQEGRRIAYYARASDAKVQGIDKQALARIQEMREEAADRSLAIAQRALAKLEWRPTGSVALVNRCTCASCGQRMLQFVGFGVDMRRESDSAVRMVMSQVLDPAYIKRTAYTPTVTQACMTCLESFGFKE